jgi:hypothetical protein
MIENEVRTIVQSAIDEIASHNLTVRGIDKTDLGWMILFWVRVDSETTGHELRFIPAEDETPESAKASLVSELKKHLPEWRKWTKYWILK